MINDNIDDASNVLVHGCGGDATKLAQTEGANTEQMLDNELRSFTMDLIAENGDTKVRSFGLYRPAGEFETCDEDYLLYPEDDCAAEFKELTTSLSRWRGSRHACNADCEEKVLKNRSGQQKELQLAIDSIIAREGLEDLVNGPNNRRPAGGGPPRKEDDRRKRNGMGILLSSLKEKVYHCRCIDCQAERRAEGKPEPEESIEVRTVELPEEIPETIVIPRKKGRGRPRIFPRIEDLLNPSTSTNQQQQETQRQEVKYARPSSAAARDTIPGKRRPGETEEDDGDYDNAGHYHA